MANIPDYSDAPYVILNNNKPDFDESDLKAESFENYSDINMINRFSQEIITDGILTKKGEQRISSFADENKEYLKKISESSKRGAYELIKHDYSVEKASYIIKLYYENLRYMDYFGEIRDVEVYMDDVNDKDILKKVRDILDYRFRKNKEK